MQKSLILFLALLVAISTCWTPWQRTVSAQEVQEVGLDEETLAKYQSLDDPALLGYIENSVYHDVVSQIDNNQYIVEKVQAVYVSKEYLEELEYNSKENEWFGYKSSELSQMFQGKQYMFTLGNDGNTEVKEFEQWQGDNLTKIMKNVEIVTGVILVCVILVKVTPVAVTGLKSTGILANAPKIINFFSVSASKVQPLLQGITRMGNSVASIAMDKGKGETIQKLTDVLSTVNDLGYQVSGFVGKTEANIDKWNDVSNQVIQGKLNSQDIADAQRRKFPAELIANLDQEEFRHYQEQDLRSYRINNRFVLMKLPTSRELTTPLSEGITNAQRLSKGQSLLDIRTEESYELHHVLQEKEGVLALLSREAHRGLANFAKLHKRTGPGVHNKGTGLTSSEWERQKREVFKGIAKLLGVLN